MSYCTSCGQRLEPQWKVCPQCAQHRAYQTPHPQDIWNIKGSFEYTIKALKRPESYQALTYIKKKYPYFIEEFDRFLIDCIGKKSDKEIMSNFGGTPSWVAKEQRLYKWQDIRKLVAEAIEDLRNIESEAFESMDTLYKVIKKWEKK